MQECLGLSVVLWKHELLNLLQLTPLIIIIIYRSATKLLQMDGIRRDLDTKTTLRTATLNVMLADTAGIRAYSTILRDIKTSDLDAVSFTPIA